MPLLVSVSPYVPQRNSPYAGHQWYFHFLRALGAHYEVVLVAPSTAENRQAAAPPCQVHLVEGVGHWRRSERQGGPLDKLGDELLRGVARVEQAAPLLARAAVVDIQWPRALPHSRALRAAAPDAVLTYVAHDVHYTNWAWDRLSAMPRGKRLAGWGVGRVVKVREVRLLAPVDAVFAFKQADLDGLRAAGMAAPGARLAPWLQKPAAPGPVGDGLDVLYVAAFDRAQNRWGADWLIHRVWPSVLAEVPGARLVLAGGGAPADLRDKAARATNVHLTGFVEDLDPLYRQAACVVAPVLGGAGLRFKVPQAMLYGRPLVVTPLALEGLDEAPGDCFAGITDEPSAFAAAVVAALRRAPPASRAAQLAPRWVETQLSFDASIDTVLEMHGRGRSR